MKATKKTNDIARKLKQTLQQNYLLNLQRSITSNNDLTADFFQFAIQVTLSQLILDSSAIHYILSVLSYLIIRCRLTATGKNKPVG